jgi:hypothetical protein
MKWFLRSLFKKSPTIRKGPAAKRRVPLDIESLEDRVVPVTIVWDNELNERAAESDFAQAFLTQQRQAIDVVTQALHTWEKIVVHFPNTNPRLANDTVRLKIMAKPNAATAMGHGGKFDNRNPFPDGSPPPPRLGRRS